MQALEPVRPSLVQIPIAMGDIYWFLMNFSLCRYFLIHFCCCGNNFLDSQENIIRKTKKKGNAPEKMLWNNKTSIDFKKVSWELLILSLGGIARKKEKLNRIKNSVSCISCFSPRLFRLKEMITKVVVYSYEKINFFNMKIEKSMIKNGGIYVSFKKNVLQVRNGEFNDFSHIDEHFTAIFRCNYRMEYGDTRLS